MSTEYKIFSAIISASLMLIGISPQGPTSLQAQTKTGGLDQYTKNRLGGIEYQNSAKRFGTARFTNQAYRTSVPQYTQYSNGNIRNQIFGSTRSSKPKKKPFSSTNRGPAVTPYLGLAGLPTGGAPNYYSNVKPRLEQQRVNQQSQRRSQAMQRQLNQVAAQPPFNPKGSDTMAPTGHSAVFMNLGGYYPQGR